LQDENRIIVSGFGGAVIHDKALMRRMRGPVMNTAEPLFFAIIIFSLVIHGGMIYWMNRIRIAPKQTLTIEQLPERLVKFVVEKPMPKKPVIDRAASDALKKEKPEPALQQAKPASGSDEVEAKRSAAQESAASRQVRVEKKIRTVGVLGLLAGAGATATGPAVIDVLGANGNRKERNQDLELALQNQAGLIKTDNAAVLSRKLVSSKEVDMADRREEIDELLEIGSGTTRDLVKTGGSIVIRPPESIEGAASSNSLRSDRSIGEVVARHRGGIRLTYDKYLKRDPGMGGKITVRFTISASGSVVNVLILENTTGSAQFEQDLIRKIKLWKFEEVIEGDVTVTYPFLFNPS
jgi:TonB family protein